MRGAGGIRAIGGALAACASLASCSSPPLTPEAHELANLSWWNEVPKSSPGLFTGVFEEICLDTPATKAPARLRALGYVPKPARVADHQLWVVDDRRPAVLTGSAGMRCAVVAEARSGQADAARRMVARRFPQAGAVAPETLGGMVESAFALRGGGHVVTLRQAGRNAPSRLMLAILRPAGGRA